MGLHRLLNQTGTYWGTPTRNRYGDTTFATPVAVTCRFESRNELFIDTVTGDQRQSKAYVWLTNAITIEVGGYLYLGTSSTANPETVTGADQIRRVEETPSVNGREILIKAVL